MALLLFSDIFIKKLRLNGLNRLDLMLQVTTYYKYLQSETATAIGSRKKLIQSKGEINHVFWIFINIFNPTVAII